MPLIDIEEDTAELEANPDTMSETVMKALFRSQMDTATCPIIRRGLLEMADKVDASIRQAEIRRAGFEAVPPSVPDASEAGGGRFGETMRAVAPR